MILDITYHDSDPEQIQHVRLATIYPNSEGPANPELVIHFDAPKYGQANIKLSRIRSLMVSND